MLRLLYLCVHPQNRSPSQRYRFEQFEPYLRARGVAIDYSAALSAEEVPTFYGATPARAKARIALRALARRVLSVRPRLGRKRYDVVFVQREAFFLFGAWSEWLAHLQAPVVFDFDDAIWMQGVSDANRRFRLLKNVDKIKDIVALSRVVLAGNAYLGQWASQYNPHVKVIPTCVDTDRYTPPDNRSGERVTIGWCGSPSTVQHFRLILPVLERIKQRYGDRIHLRMMGDPRFHHAPLDLIGEPWSSDAEVAFLRDMDIGLMPLPDDEWSKGKCGLKGLTSMACGAATVMSPVGVNSSIVQHGTNGLLASTADDWFESLSRLVEDRSLRERLGRAGRETLVREYSVERWKGNVFQAIQDAAEGGP